MNIKKSIEESIKERQILKAQERNKKICRKMQKRMEPMEFAPSSLCFNDGREGLGAPPYFYTSPCPSAKKESGNPVVEYDKDSDTFYIPLKNGEKIYITKWQKESIDKAKKIFDAFEEIPYSEHQDEWDESSEDDYSFKEELKDMIRDEVARAMRHSHLKSGIKSIEKFVDKVKDDYDNYVHYNTTRVLGENLVEDIPAPPGMLSFKKFLKKECKKKDIEYDIAKNIAKSLYSKER